MYTLTRSTALLLLGLPLFSSCITPSMPDPDPAASMITALTPSVMIPGGPLRLTATNLAGATGIDFTDENGVAAVTVPAGSFLPTGGAYSLSEPPDSRYVTVKIPMNVLASYVRINNEHGPGNLQRVSNGYNRTSYIGDLLTTSNIATNVSAFVTSTISDSKCNPSYFYYCMPVPKGSRYPEEYGPNTPYTPSTPIKDSRIVVAFKQSSVDCKQVYYDSLRIGKGQWYRVFRGHTNVGPNGAAELQTPPVRLKLERNSLNTGYTGTAILTIETYSTATEPYKQYTYVGSMVKTPASKTGSELFDIRAYEVKTGDEIRLCNQKGYLQGSCPDCQ